MTEDRMSPVDYLLHRGERDPRTRSDVVSVEILDRTPQWDRFVRTFDRASRAVTRMRQKVVVPAVPTTVPRWVVDPDFDLAYHVRRLRLPEPGSRRQLLDLAEQEASAVLDPNRPLWTAALVEGLAGGQAEVLTHMSHAVTDGLGAVELFAQIYDLSRDAERGPLPPLPAPLDLTPVELARAGLGELPSAAAGTLTGLVTDLAGRLGRAVTAPVELATETYDYLRSAARVLGTDHVTEPSPLLRRRGLSRRAVTLDLDLDRLKAAAANLGGSVNDTYLAGVCAALRRYHDEHGVPVATLPMAIPVSVRSARDGRGGNQFAGVRLAAPVGETHPRLAVRRLHEQVARGRAEPALEVVERLAGVLNLLPDPLLDAVAGGLAPADIQASNLPSYPDATYLAGAQVVAQYALGPLPGIAAMVVFISRMGKCFVSVRYDTASFTDDESLERCLAAGFEDVLAYAEPPTSATGRPTRKRPAGPGSRGSRGRPGSRGGRVTPR